VIAKQAIIKAFILIVSVLWHSFAYTEITSTHRMINSKAIENGTQITFHLHLFNQASYNYLDLTMSPIDPAVLLSPNETTVSIELLETDQRIIIPWKVTVPYSADKFHNDLPIAFQGSAIDEFGNTHIVLVFSHQEAEK